MELWHDSRGSTRGELAFLPCAHADETLGSVVSRYATYTGASSVGAALDALGRTGSCPSGGVLNWARAFAGTLRGFRGVDARAYLWAATLLPFQSAFWSSDERKEAMAWMCDRTGEAAPAQLLAPAASALIFGVPRHRMFYCPACSAADREELGEYYWHRTLQLPLVHCCPACGVRTVPIGDPYGSSSQHIFSADCIAGNPTGRCDAVRVSESEGKLSAWCGQILSGEIGPYLPERLAPLYRSLLLERCTPLFGPCSASRQASDWEAYVLSLLWAATGPDFCLGTAQQMRLTSWGRFLGWIQTGSPDPASRNPSSHLMLWIALGLSPDDLEAAEERRYPSPLG